MHYNRQKEQNRLFRRGGAVMATSAQLRKQILQGSWDAVLAALYGADPAVLQRQRGRYAAALEQFELYFGPGRQ